MKKLLTSQPRRTWRRRAEARPDEILTAALEEFNVNGFDASRVEDIAARAGVSKAAVYLYFDSKEALLRALIEREVAPIADQVTAAAEAGMDDPKSALRGMARIIASALGQARAFAVPLLVISIAARFPDLAQCYRERVAERARTALTRLIRRGVEIGQFRAVDPVAAARATIGPIMFEILWTHALKGQAERDTKWIDTQFDILLNGMAMENAL
jgi:AcrR family transcriptional regulator